MIFAYGSLVHPATRPKDLGAMPASLIGWSREWMHHISTPYGKVCALTVSPEHDTSILGVVLSGNNDNNFEIDEREIGYERIQVIVQPTGQSEASPLPASLYIGKSDERGPATREYPIWRSYLDCVLDGYLMLGGETAVEAFVKSTRGWPAPILDDRSSPKYPRAVSLSADKKSLIDGLLRRNLLLSGLFSESD